MSHPPFAHNPHVYNGIDPDGNPTSGLVVSRPDLAEPVEEATEVDPPATSDEDVDVDVNGDGRIDGYEAFTKAELQAECERLGLPTTGNKPDLVARLQEADQAPED